MPNLSAVQVRSELKIDGTADYPDFNTLPQVIASGKDWSVYVDSSPNLGILYDQKSGHRHDDTTNDSPLGIHRIMIVAEPQFCIEAASTFSTRCEHLTEDNAQTFYNTRVTPRNRDEDWDYETLCGLHSGIWLADRILLDGPHVPTSEALAEMIGNAKKALRLDNDYPGRRDYPLKNWGAFKNFYSITYVEPV